MSAEASIAFVDTSVLVYAFAEDHPDRHDVARRLITQLTEAGTLRLSMQVLQEFFVTATAKTRKPLARDEALRRMDSLSEWLTVATDYAAIRDAVALAGEAIISFGDALIVVAAARSGATVLYTEDLNHGQKLLGVKIVNPFK
jgi:predicted nucleic acid-binding protein